MAVDLKRVPKGERAAVKRLLQPTAPSKYGNRRAQSRDGYSFASQRERNRYEELLILQEAGEITGLVLQPRYPLKVQGVGGLREERWIKVGTYVADFAYREKGQHVIEDVKGHRTQVYLLKRKLMKALYGIEIKEI